MIIPIVFLTISIAHAGELTLFEALRTSCTQRCLSRCANLEQCDFDCDRIAQPEFEAACSAENGTKVLNPRCWQTCNDVLSLDKLLPLPTVCETAALDFQIISFNATSGHVDVNITWPTFIVVPWLELREKGYQVVSDLDPNPNIEYGAQLCGVVPADTAATEKPPPNDRLRWEDLDSFTFHLERPGLFSVFRPGSGLRPALSLTCTYREHETEEAYTCASDFDYETLYPDVHHHNKKTEKAEGPPLLQVSWTFKKPPLANDTMWMRWTRIGSISLYNETGKIFADTPGTIRKLASQSNTVRMDQIDTKTLYGIQVCAFHQHIHPLEFHWAKKEIFGIVPDRKNKPKDLTIKIVLAVVILIFIASAIAALVCHCMSAKKGEPFYTTKKSIQKKVSTVIRTTSTSEITSPEVDMKPM